MNWIKYNTMKAWLEFVTKRGPEKNPMVPKEVIKERHVKTLRRLSANLELQRLAAKSEAAE